MIRLYFSPIIGDGSPLDPYRAKVSGSMIIRTHPQGHIDYGKPVESWALVLSNQPDYTTEDADTDNDRVFGIDLPDTITTKAELRAYLQSRTIGEIPTARRTALQTKLANRGVDLTGINLQSTWWDVLKRIRRRLDAALENADG